MAPRAVRRRLPPLGALVAFEAAGRHLSFTRAAAELHVTQTAISHQVRALEEHLAVRLFRRLPRALSLTDAGERFLPVVREALDRIDEASARLRQRDASGTLTVSVLPSFAARWLVPRLGRFRAAHPTIDVRIDARPELVDFVHDDVDVAVRYGRGRYPGLRADRLMAEEIFPVCSPALRRGRPPLRRPNDLRHHTLLHAETHDDWHAWLLARGVRGVEPTRGPMFTDSSMVVQAAVAGQGVALGRRVLVDADLAAGRLVRPFGRALPSAFAYFVVCPESGAERPKVRAFREWLLAEARAVPYPHRTGLRPAP